MNTYCHEAGTLRFELRGELEHCEVRFREESPQPDLLILHVELKTERKSGLPEVVLAFPLPQKDVQVRWMPDYPACHHLFPYWWKGGRIPSALNRNAPVYSYLNLEGKNRMTCALSDVQSAVRIHTGPSEQSEIINEITVPPPENRTGIWTFALRVDCRAIHFSEALSEVAGWYAQSLPPAPVPEAARLPFYSSWYQFQRDVSAGKLEQELPELERYGLKTIILDDGWNCSGETVPGTFAHCGDWMAAPDRFPDMAAHIRKFHERGIRYMLWFPVPFVGILAPEDFSRFQGKFLGGGSKYKILDPRFPEVRRYLVELYEKFVRQWELDGLKLDFIDSFTVSEQDPAREDGYAGRDLRSVPEAVDVLLSAVRERLTAINPEIMIEFRQRYIGPGMRQYGTIFRAADCAMDLLENRVRTVDLRLLAGETAVHSDMLIWSPRDTPEVAALQIQNIIFSVPQISCHLVSLPDSHKRMLAFWMDFCIRHRKTLQSGTFRPEHPELSYPLVSATGDDEAITAVYLTGSVVPHIPCGKHIVLNAKHSETVVLDVRQHVSVTVSDVFGQCRRTCRLEPGIAAVSVPSAGFLEIECAETES